MKRLFFFVLILFCPLQSFADTAITAGEVLKYGIKKLRFKAGNAEFVFNGQVQKNGQEAVYLKFSTNAVRFTDEEDLFLDPLTYHPLVVERDIVLFGKSEKITETYAKDIGSVKIVKTTKKGTTEQVINKEGRLENIYGFIYRYRQSGTFKIGDKISVNLPTKDIVMEVKRKEKISIDKVEYDTYYLESDSHQYKIWFSADERKIPVKIEGASGFGNTSMVYQP